VSLSSPTLGHTLVDVHYGTQQLCVGMAALRGGGHCMLVFRGQCKDAGIQKIGIGSRYSGLRAARTLQGRYTVEDWAWVGSQVLPCGVARYKTHRMGKWAHLR
jgi:hypothetical protein